MFIATINTFEAVDLFNQLMQPDAQFRILRLVGDAKMGKSHLLTKVFPNIVEQNTHASYAVLDLRNSLYVVPDILHMACSFLDKKNENKFDSYFAAHQEWSNRPQVKAQGIYAIASSLRISGKSGPDQSQARDLDLTRQFVKDLSKLDDKLLLLMFDSVSESKEAMQMWLMDTFLVAVSRLPHVRVIVSGRSLPGANGSYTLFCKSYRLQAITEVDEFVSYCRKLNARIGEQSIRDFAYACDFNPGMFVDLVYPRFMK